MANDWTIACSLERLRQRARMLADIRTYFADNDVLEVETPILGQAIGTDVNLDFFTTHCSLSTEEQILYLQTSPEFAMKRMLAAGSGSIFQICKAFRKGEAGRLHNPEFTVLEWYRVGFDLHQLMLDIEALLTQLFKPYRPLKQTQKISYADVFYQYTGLDALQFDQQRYINSAKANNLSEAERICGVEHAVWLDFLFSHLVQPNFPEQTLVLVVDYPACLPSLARLSPEDPKVSERVEVFIDGVELGNGYYELSDYSEQLARFEVELKKRKAKGLALPPLDLRFLEAIKQGLPDCSGIAIGLDRLLMILLGQDNLEKILAFPLTRA